MVSLSKSAAFAMTKLSTVMPNYHVLVTLKHGWSFVVVIIFVFVSEEAIVGF